MEPSRSAEALVLIPGLLCDATIWEPQRQALQDRAHIWIPDISRFASLAEAVRAILADAPFDSFSLAGLSMGGYLAALAAVQAPSRVSRLALLNTRAHVRESGAGRQKRIAQIELARRDFPEAVERLLPALLRPDARKDEGLMRTVREMSLGIGAEVFVRQQQANMDRPEIAMLLGQIACPTWIIGGDQDAIADEASQQALAQAIPGARLHMLRGCGHLSTLERPDEVNQLLHAWLDT